LLVVASAVEWLLAGYGPAGLKRRAAAEKASDAEVLVDVGPMNALAVAEELPVLPLG